MPWMKPDPIDKDAEPFVDPIDKDAEPFVEVDPTGRYGRYSCLLGAGAVKRVYRAFDQEEGIEVAWNQVKLSSFVDDQKILDLLYTEVRLLQSLRHDNIITLYKVWTNANGSILNFITEVCTSGNLREYRKKHRHVLMKALKKWSWQILMGLEYLHNHEPRQILKGLLYLHSLDPPVIHRDLKCDNIFINGNQGEVKIGDLGLAAILRKSHAAHCVGTPEFMAPEVYEEEYNELVDIYSFGMCVLEMVTFEYPYSECTHPAQIYKKVVSGTKPDALYRVKDPEVRQFVEKCLATVSRRLPARELLKDPFLQIDDRAPSCRDGDVSDIGIVFRQPFLGLFSSNVFGNGCSDDLQYHSEIENGWDYDAADISAHGMNLFNGHEDEPVANVDITIKGRRKEDGGIFLRLRIADKDGRVRNIYFPFDTETDTALSVATEMVAELDITDYEVTRIAEMIDSEVSSLVPEWEPGPGIAETPRFAPAGLCGNCASNVSSCGSLLDYLSKTPGFANFQSVHCTNLECAAMHGRFEEITYQMEGSEEQCVMEGAPGLSTSHSDEESEGEGRGLHQSARDERVVQMNGIGHTRMRKSMGDLDANFDIPEFGVYQYSPTNLSDDYENEIRQELRWLKAKYQMELRDYKNRQFGGSRRVLHPSPDLQNRDCRLESGIQDCSSSDSAQIQVFDEKPIKSFTLEAHLSARNCHSDRSSVHTSCCPVSEAKSARDCEANVEGSPELFTAKNFYADGALLPNCLTRTKSLPVDAVDV